MSKQRFAVIVVALIGMIATFLPWYRIAQTGTVSGISSFGWLTFIMFIVVIMLALRKNMQEDMSMGVSWSVAAFGLLAAFVVLWKMIDVWFAKEGILTLSGADAVLGNSITVGYGAWIALSAGICIPFIAFLFRDRKFRRV